MYNKPSNNINFSNLLIANIYLSSLAPLFSMDLPLFYPIDMI
jgi:hypothetical protein